MDDKTQGIDVQSDRADDPVSRDATRDELEESIEDSVEQEEIASEEDGFDADEYVRQLIARMGTGDDLRIALPPGPPPKMLKANSEALPDPSAKNSPKALPLSSAPASLDELARTSKKASSGGGKSSKRLPATNVLPVDLAKLREAANITTSGALQTFDRKGLVRGAYYQLAFAVGCMATSLVLLTMSQTTRSVAYISSVTLLFVAALATLLYTRTRRALGQG